MVVVVVVGGRWLLPYNAVLAIVSYQATLQPTYQEFYSLLETKTGTPLLFFETPPQKSCCFLYLFLETKTGTPLLFFIPPRTTPQKQRKPTNQNQHSREKEVPPT